MVELKEKKVLSDNGKTIAVQLNLRDYKILESYIEDLEDSLTLAEAIKNAKGFRLWEEFVAGLRM